MALEFNELKYIVSGLQELKTLSRTLNNVARAQNKLVASLNTINRSSVQAGASLQRISGSVNTLTTQTVKGTKSAKQFGITWQGVTRIIIGSLVSRGIGGLIRGLQEGISEAQEFGLRIAEVSTISQDAQLSFTEWSDAVRKLSDEFGTPLLETTEGLYQAISNQIAKGAEATEFMAEAQRFALIAVSNTDQAVNLLTGALNSFKLEADDARQVANSFFKTIELGRIRARDLAQNFGQVGIVAAQLGLRLEEVQASLAVLTIQGLAPTKAMTGLRNVLLKLIRPTDRMKEFFEKIGVTSGQAAIDTFGFVGVLRLLAREVQETGDPLNELGEIFGRLRAIVGGAGLVGSFDEFGVVLNKIENAAESANKALLKITDTAEFKLKRELQRVTDFFVVDLGQKSVKGIIELTEEFGGLAEIVKTVTAGLAAGAAAFAVVLAGVGTVALAGIIAALVTTGTVGVAAFSALAIAAAALGTAFGIVSGFSSDMKNEGIKSARELTKEFKEASKERVNIIQDETQKQIKLFTAAAQQQQSEIARTLAFIRKGVTEDKKLKEEQLELEEKLFEAQKGILKPAEIRNILLEKYVVLLREVRPVIANEDIVSANILLDRMQKISDEIKSQQKSRSRGGFGGGGSSVTNAISATGERLTNFTLGGSRTSSTQNRQ